MNNGWMDLKEFEKKLTKIPKGDIIEKSGIPMMYDEENLYIDEKEGHTLVIGSTGSGKTQSTLLPQARLAIEAGESLVINDIKGEIYDIFKDVLKEKNYNTIILNFNDKKSNKFNPLSLAQKLYKNNEKDRAMEIVEIVGKQLVIEDMYNEHKDPFWENTAINFFTGLTLYLFDNNDKEITICDVFDLMNNFEKEQLNKYDKTSSIYVNLAGTILAPQETKGSIISVLSQKLKNVISREILNEVMSTTDFDINNITEQPTAIFIINSCFDCVNRIIPIIVKEIYMAVSYKGSSNKKINILLDDFDSLKTIDNLNIMLEQSRSLNIKFTIYIKSLIELRHRYGRFNIELIKISFQNIIYLLANDYETLEDFSRMCGRVKEKDGYEPLITPEELKLINQFEAIILIPRMLPIKTKLLPYYKIEWK